MHVNECGLSLACELHIWLLANASLKVKSSACVTSQSWCIFLVSSRCPVNISVKLSRRKKTSSVPLIHICISICLEYICLFQIMHSLVFKFLLWIILFWFFVHTCVIFVLRMLPSQWYVSRYTCTSYDAQYHGDSYILILWHHDKY